MSLPISLALSALLFAGLVGPTTAFAQAGPERRTRHYDGHSRDFYRGPVRFTAGAGVALYNGDLTNGLSGQFPGPSFSLGGLYTWRPHWLVGAEATYFQLGAKDYLPARGLAFRDRNGQGTVFVRFEPLHDEGEYALRRRPAALFKPYLKLGVGLTLYNPKAYYGTTRFEDGMTILPQERNDYPAMALVAPVGVGLTARLTARLNATLEGAYYFTTTDQLDDISPASGRSISSLNDGYGLIELKLEYAPWGR